MAFRPRNETTEDLAHEAIAKSRIELERNVQIIKLSPVLYRVDWALFNHNDTLRGFAEYKFRSRRYDTLMLGARKWQTGCDMADFYDVPFYLFVDWPEGLYWYRWHPEDERPNFKVKLDGSSRGQNGDIEPCVHIPTDLFKLVSKKVE